MAGLPALEDPRILAGVVREGRERFFLGEGSPRVTTGVRVEEAGVVWAAELDAGVVRELEAGCGAAGVRLRAVAPAAVVLSRVFGEGRLVWRDGPGAAELRFEDGART